MIVLDTHAWIWFVADPKRLSAPARRAMDAEAGLGVPTICCWEVGMLVAKGRLKLDDTARAWVRRALAVPRIELLDLTPDIAVASTEPDLVERLPGDPADRMLVATALAHRTRLVTRDRRMHNSGLVECVW